MRLKISLRLRLLLTFLVVALVPIALIAALNASSVILLLREEVETHQIEATTLIASDIQSFADHLVYELTQAGQLALLRPGEPGGLLRDALYISSGYESVRLIDPNGDEIARLENGELARRADLTNLSADEIFFRPMRGETYFSALRVIDGSPSIDVAAPLVEGGTIIGVIAAEVRLNLPWEQIVGRVIGSTGYVLLTDRRGNVIAAPQAIDSSASLLNTPPMRAIFAGQTRAAAYEYISPISDQSVLGVGIPIEPAGWVLFTERSAAEAYTTYTQARINLILAVGIGAALALLLGVIVAQRITRPVASLQRTVRRVAVGDLDARSTVIGDDEISELARGFNQMAQALNQRIAEIDEKNRALSIATAEAREASRLKDEFLAVMSHELRTPLNAIIGFTGVILMESDQLTARHTHLLTRLEANSERLLALINDILDISRIEAGRLEIVPSEIDLRKMVGRLCDQLAVLAQERQLAFSYQFDDALPQKVWLDEDGLTKIVTNLISNAIKFTDQGSVRVDLRRQGENTLLIEVSDTGRGIPAHMQEIIFERFRQVDGSVTREHGGTGLGLAIVRRMCEAMGGTVRVRSVIGEGSTFTVLLPFETQAVTT